MKMVMKMMMTKGLKFLMPRFDNDDDYEDDDGSTDNFYCLVLTMMMLMMMMMRLMMTMMMKTTMGALTIFIASFRKQSGRRMRKYGSYPTA